MEKEQKRTPPHLLVFFGREPRLVQGEEVGESPDEFFRSLGPEAPPFFQGLASVAFDLQDGLSSVLIPGELYTPSSIKRVVGLTERMAAMFTPEGEFSLSYLGKEESFTADRKSIDGIRLRFSHQLAGRVCKVYFSFSSNTRRTTFGENGQPFECFDGLRLEELRRMLSLQGKLPEEISQMIQKYEENFPSLRIVSGVNGRAEFRATFLRNFAFCKLSVEGGIYDREEPSDSSQEDQDDSASLKGVITTTAYNFFPLLRFTRSEGHFSSQEAVDRWLNRIAVDIVEKARVSKEIKGNERR